MIKATALSNLISLKNQPKLRAKSVTGEEVFNPHTQKNLTTRKEIKQWQDYQG